MPTQPVLFSDQELKVIQEVKHLMGFETDEETIEDYVEIDPKHYETLAEQTP